MPSTMPISTSLSISSRDWNVERISIRVPPTCVGTVGARGAGPSRSLGYMSPRSRQRTRAVVETRCHCLRCGAHSMGTLGAVTLGARCSTCGSYEPGRAWRLDSPVSASAPFGWDGVVRGALSVRSTASTRSFTLRDLDVLATLGAIAGAATRHAYARHASVPEVCRSVGDFAEMLGERDPLTVEHSDRIVATACMVARALEVPPPELAELKL